MNSSLIMIVVLVIAVIAIAAIAFGISRKRRSQKLRERFGPEYDRVVRSEGDVRKGEGVLAFREKRRQKLEIRALSPADRSGFLNRWNDVQAASWTIPKVQSLKPIVSLRKQCRHAAIRWATSISVLLTFPWTIR